MRIRIVFFLLTFLLASCSTNSFDAVIGLPTPPTEGSDAYLAGWKEGCSTGMGAYGNSYYRTRYRATVTPELMSDRDYSKAWSVANRYCNYYVGSYLKMGSIDYGYKSSSLQGKNTWFNDSESETFFGMPRLIKNR